MQKNRSIPDAVVIPVLAYADVREAARWLCEAFGFSERVRIGDHRVQLTVGSGALVVAQSPEGGPGPGADSVMVRVADADAHAARAEAHGAKIVAPPTDHPYGERQYSVLDPGGHRWTFTQTIADVDPRSWGGEVVGDSQASEAA
jgi:uncharacterized glyoxalase superfamily protein PhnB